MPSSCNDQRERAREARLKPGRQGLGQADHRRGWASRQTVFLGYETIEDRRRRSLASSRGQERWTMRSRRATRLPSSLDRTPFYAESGGQVGDTRRHHDGGGGRCQVEDHASQAANRPVPPHRQRSHRAASCVGDRAHGRRWTPTPADAIMRNHSACHLLQAALRKVLGTHVEQAGSYVDARTAAGSTSPTSPP